jgi:hypothetical protein
MDSQRIISIPMRLRFLAPLVLALLMLPAGSSSADQIGTAVVGGKTIIIDSNGTWSFEDAATAEPGSDCDRLSGIKLCLKKAGWHSETPPDNFKLLFQNSAKYYLGIVLEPTGAKDGFTYELLQTAIITNAARGAGIRPAQVPVLDAQTNMKGHPGLRSVTFAVKVKGAPFIFHTVYKVYPDKAVQFVFWGLGTTMTKEFSEKIDTAIANIAFE